MLLASHATAAASPPAPAHLDITINGPGAARAGEPARARAAAWAATLGPAAAKRAVAAAAAAEPGDGGGGGGGGTGVAHVTQIQGGITNRLYKIDPPPADADAGGGGASGGPAVLVRVYGEGSDIFIDRKLDERVFAELTALGFGVRLLATLNDGRVEQFYDSARTLEPDDLADPALSARIARRLCELHHLPVTASLAADGRPAPCLMDTLRTWFGHASKVAFADDAAKQARLTALDLPRLGAEIESTMAQRVCGEAGGGGGGGDTDTGTGTGSSAAVASPVVFAHNDLLAGNILVRTGSAAAAERAADAEGGLVFVDVEYAAYNFRGFDIGNHFCEFSGFAYTQFEAKYPRQEAQDLFLKAYLRRDKELQQQREGAGVAAGGERKQAADDNGANAVAVTSEEVAALRREVAHYAIGSHLFWGLWAVIQARHSPIDFDYLEYARGRFAAYFVAKEWVFGGGRPAGVGAAARGAAEDDDDDGPPAPITAPLLEARLTKRLPDVVFVRVTDDSGGCGAKFSVIVVTPAFDGVRLLDRHRMINGSAGVLASEMESIHALQLKTWTPKQWEKKKSKYL